VQRRDARHPTNPLGDVDRGSNPVASRRDADLAPLAIEGDSDCRHLVRRSGTCWHSHIIAAHVRKVCGLELEGTYWRFPIKAITEDAPAQRAADAEAVTPAEAAPACSQFMEEPGMARTPRKSRLTPFYRGAPLSAGTPSSVRRTGHSSPASQE
jgi:hypothetical protein